MNVYMVYANAFHLSKHAQAKVTAATPKGAAIVLGYWIDRRYGRNAKGQYRFNTLLIDSNVDREAGVVSGLKFECP